jgi:hypothetical protein
MAEVAALEKHDCVACGAQATWHPARQMLVCGFCGTEAPYRVDAATGRAEELDLVRALRELPDEQRGWQAEKRSVQCQSCKAISVFDPGRVGQNCEFCGSPALVGYQEIKAPVRPQSLLPFRVSESQVRESMRRWFGSHWLAPGALKRRGLVDTVHGVYVPYWTFDAHAAVSWTAEAGFTTYVTVNRRRVPRVRWQKAGGAFAHAFDDELVPATRGVQAGLLKGIEPFPTADLAPYDTAYLSGFVVEHYQFVLAEAAQRAQEAMNARLRQLCIQQIPGDTHRSLDMAVQLTRRTFKHVLLPVWLLHYSYGPRRFQVVVNGSTGVIAGDAPISPWKVALLVLGALIVLALFLLAD